MSRDPRKDRARKRRLRRREKERTAQLRDEEDWWLHYERAQAGGQLRWLWAKIKSRDPDVMRALREISARHSLVCSCAPRPCHGDVVVAAWRWLNSLPRESR